MSSRGRADVGNYGSPMRNPTPFVPCRTSSSEAASDQARQRSCGAGAGSVRGRSPTQQARWPRSDQCQGVGLQPLRQGWTDGDEQLLLRRGTRTATCRSPICPARPVITRTASTGTWPRVALEQCGLRARWHDAGRAPSRCRTGGGAADHVHELGTLLDQEVACPVQRQCSLLLSGAYWHEPHRRARHPFADRFSVVGVVLPRALHRASRTRRHRPGPHVPNWPARAPSSGRSRMPQCRPGKVAAS